MNQTEKIEDNQHILALLGASQTNLDCWRGLKQINRTIDFCHISKIGVSGLYADEYCSFLQQTFADIEFIAKPVNQSWSCWEIISRGDCDIMAVCALHAPELAGEIAFRHSKYARVSAKRDIGDGRALSIFGKELFRPLFRPDVRNMIAA